MSNKIWKKSLTVQLIFLVIISRFFCSTFNSFYLPALIVVFDHMCLLFCITETEAAHKKEEEENMRERLFHLNNCWLCQKCLVSYSVQIDVVKSRIRIWHQMVWRAVGCLGEGKKKMCLLLGHLWGEKEDPKEDTSSVSPNPSRRNYYKERSMRKCVHVY